MVDIKILEKIGLSKAEIKIYLALLSLGSTTSGNIVRETNCRKSTVYESIKRLQTKGLVSFVIKNNIRYYQATDPDKLIDFIDDKKREIENTKSDVKKLILEIKKGFSITKPHAQAHVLEGIEGFKTMRRDVLKHTKSEHLLIGAISRESEVIPGFFKEWNKKRQSKKIKIKILHKDSARRKEMAKKEFMGSLFETRFFPEGLESPSVINIYGDRVVNVLWHGKKPLCFLLINNQIADSYKKYFNHLWKLAK